MECDHHRRVSRDLFQKFASFVFRMHVNSKNMFPVKIAVCIDGIMKIIVMIKIGVRIEVDKAGFQSCTRSLCYRPEVIPEIRQK